MEIWKRMQKDSLVVTTPPHLVKRWSPEEKQVFEQYAHTIYEQHGVQIVPFEEIQRFENNKTVYFNDSRYIPFFEQDRYRIEAVAGTRLDELLDRVPDHAIVLIAVLDEGSQAIRDDACGQRLRAIGIHLTQAHLRSSYAWVACKRPDGTWEVLAEELSEGPVILTSAPWEALFPGLSFELVSHGALAGGECRIVVNGVRQGASRRGMNICIIQPETLQTQYVVADTFTTTYCEGAWYAAYPETAPALPDVWEDPSIAHACGELEGIAYTNAKEALLDFYMHKGFRLFEIDLISTADHEMVARHDWLPYLYDYLRQPCPVEGREGAPLSRAQAMALPILHNYTPMDLNDILTIMKAYPDMRIITDTKSVTKAEVVGQFAKIRTEAEAYGRPVIDRIIPQLYHLEMYDWVKEIYAGWRCILTLYQCHATNEEIVAFVREKSIPAVVMTPERCTPELSAELRRSGAKVIFHTINDPEEMERYVGLLADGIMTDRLSAESIRASRKLHMAVEAAYHDAVRLYLAQRFGLERDVYDAWVARCGLLHDGKRAAEAVFRQEERSGVLGLFESAL